MKNLILITSILLCALSLSAQKIYSALEINNGKPQEVLYIFLTRDDKLIDDLIPKHYKSYGDFNNNTLSLEKDLNIHPEVDNVDIIVKHEKDYSKVSYFFFDAENKAIAGADLDQEAANNFIYDFYDLLINAQEKEIVQNDIDLVNEEVNKGSKEIKKLKRSIERNLRDQEKLGKKLDATPEELTNLIEEKNNVLQDKLEMDIALADSTNADKELIEKKVDKVEKAIIKKQKQSDKNAARLAKKETQLEELTQELLDTQSLLRKLEKVLQRKQILVLKA